MALDPGTLLGRYEILGPIAAGGMGEVYRARDTRLERAVAVKVLPARLADEPARRERFEREARAIAALAHPNVCVLFDAGLHEGSPYLVMEHLEGDTLADRIARGPLPPADALRIAAEVAQGLAAAHARGIVHRDLKPANVKLAADGRAKVLDFGLALRRETAARVPGDDDATAASPITGAHTLLGTMGYMSPEQARGQPVDQRTDVWALGVVVYEMLCGRRLFAGASVADLIVSVLQQEIRLDALPEGVTAEARALIAGCLERDLGRRASDMRGLAGAFAAAGAGPGRPAEPAAAAATRGLRQRSIAVLPFADLSPDRDNEYFSDGLTEEVIADLSKVESLRVISRGTAMRFKGGSHDLRAIADQLEVRHVLEGSVRKAGNGVRITAQLVDVETDAPVWSEKFSGTLDDVFEIQEKVSRAIVAALRVKLTDSERHALGARPARNAAAYDLYLRTGRDVWSFTREGIERALSVLEPALRAAGDDPLLLRRFGTAHWQYFNAGFDTDPARLARAEDCALRLGALDPEGPHAEALLGYVSASRGSIVDWVRHSNRAAARAPKDPEANVWLAFGLTVADCPDLAKPVFERVELVDPLSDMLHACRGFVEFLEGRPASALSHYERARSLTPESPIWVFIMAQAAAAERPELLFDVVRRCAPAPDSSPLAALPHMLAEAFEGRRTLLDRTVDEAYRAKLSPDLQYSHALAQIYAILGETDDSLLWLEQSTRRGFIHYPFLATRDRSLDSLRGDARFAALLERVRRDWTSFRSEAGLPPRT